jgi:hypothetical protein
MWLRKISVWKGPQIEKQQQYQTLYLAAAKLGKLKKNGSSYILVQLTIAPGKP